MDLQVIRQQVTLDYQQYVGGIQNIIQNFENLGNTVDTFVARTRQATALNKLNVGLNIPQQQMQDLDKAASLLRQMRLEQERLAKLTGTPGTNSVTTGLHPYYIMHQLHSAWQEAGSTITYAIRSGLSEISSLVGQGVQSGMASIGVQVATLLHSALGVGTALGGGIGGLGGAIGGGITRFGQAYAQGQGGMLGAGLSGLGTAVTAGAIFNPTAGAITGLVGAANVMNEYVRMKIDTSLAALATSFNLGMVGAEAIGGTLVELTAKFVTLGAGMERARVTINAFAQDGGGTFSMLQKMTREMPIYSFQELNQEMQTLVGEGIPLDQVGVVLRKLGDVAHGDEAIFHRAALAVGEIYAQGYVSSQRIRQLASIGIGTHDLARAMGIGDEEFLSKLHRGEVGVNVLIRALNSLTEAGGRFAGQNSKQLDTVFGQWQRLHTVVDQAFGKIGESILERSGLKGGLSGISDWIEGNFNTIQEVALGVFDRIKVAGQVVAEYLKAAWQTISDMVGLTGKNAGDLLPPLERVREVTKEILNVFVNLSREIIGVLRTALHNLPQAGTDLPGLAGIVQSRGLEYESQQHLQLQDRVRERFANDPAKLQQALDLLRKTHEQTVKEISSGQYLSGLPGLANRLRSGGLDILGGAEDRLGGFWENFQNNLAGGRGFIGGMGGRPGSPFAGVRAAQVFPEGAPLPQVANAVGVMVAGGVSAAMRRYMPPGLDRIPERPEGYSPGARRYLESLRREEEAGGRTPVEHFFQRMKYIAEIEAGKLPPGFVGPPNLSTALFQLTGRAKAEEIEKMGKSLPQLSSLFPKAVGEFTSEAQDTINRTNFDQRSVQQEVRDILTRALKEQEEQTIRQGLIKDALQDLVNNGFNFKGDPAGVN